MDRTAQKREYRQRIRRKFFELYGLICVCCGEDTYEFLTINHKDGKGAEHRTALFGGTRASGGVNFYQAILKLPEKDANLETMCFNCNTADHIFGICPHQQDKILTTLSL